MQNELHAIEKLLEDNDYSCIQGETINDEPAVYCFQADRFFVTLQEALDWMNEEE